MVKGNKPTFRKWIGSVLKQGVIQIPDGDGSITLKLPAHSLEQSWRESL